MKLNLDSVRNEIDEYLKKAGLVVFYSFARDLRTSEIEWDTKNYPDYKQFIDVAHQLGVKLAILHQQQFSSDLVDRAMDELEASSLEREERRTIENRLRDLALYDGFTCAIELSFDYEGNVYVYELRTEWYSELSEILDQLDIGLDTDDGDEEDPFSGYYSKN